MAVMIFVAHAEELKARTDLVTRIFAAISPVRTREIFHLSTFNSMSVK